MFLHQPVDAAPVSDCRLANSGREKDSGRLATLCQSNLTVWRNPQCDLVLSFYRSPQLAAFAELTIRQRVPTHEPDCRATTGVGICTNRDLVW